MFRSFHSPTLGSLATLLVAGVVWFSGSIAWAQDTPDAGTSTDAEARTDEPAPDAGSAEADADRRHDAGSQETDRPDASASAEEDNEEPVVIEVPRDEQQSSTPSPGDNVDLSLDTISIIGRHEELPRVAGSAQVITEEELERFDHDDIHRVLPQVPGVYVRGEDGYGLRPNIGLRGANSDRSAKITLMEDGILLAPAPYSAPAAYYFPLMARIAGVEIFKGPASIRHGPNTIGGALNLQARQIPRDMAAYLDLGYGMERFGRVHGYWGTSGRNWGVLLEGVHLQSDGFKDLDGGGDTGFDRNEVVARARYHTSPSASLYHQFDLRVGYADEESRETYLGLTDADFNTNPYRRYPASQLGLMDWYRTQVRLGYYLARGEELDLQVVGYRHDFSRDWRKLNRFRGGPELRDVLANPDAGQSAVFQAVLTGQEDSVGDEQTLLIGTNARSFASEGIALVGHWRPVLGSVSQEIELGVRFHYDQIERNHTEDGYLMQNGTLVREESETDVTTRNRASARAWAFHLHDQIGIGDLTLAPGLRLEVINTDFRDRLTDTTQSNSDVVLLPGIGAHYQLTSWLGVLAGVHRGFSPVSPGQPEEIEPEQSINYEAGTRVSWRKTKAELIGFFNDYSNLTGECTLSSGCTDALLNRQFNGGEVFVYGLEAMLSQEVDGPWESQLFGRALYTLTLSRFRTSFSSGNPQFGDVTEGDELPYVPNHQGTLLGGIRRDPWELNFSVSYVGEMRDIAGQGSIPDNERIDDHVVVDLASSVHVTDNTRIYLTINNLLNAEYITSRRPFGARPGRPFQFLLGLKYSVGP